MDKKNKDAAQGSELNDEKLGAVSGGAFVGYGGVAFSTGAEFGISVICTHPLSNRENMQIHLLSKANGASTSCPYFVPSEGNNTIEGFCNFCKYASSVTMGE